MNVETKYKRIKQSLFGLILLLLFVPLVQQQTKFAKERSLKGAYTETENPVLSMKGWSEGEYQKTKQQYINEQFGFRPFFIHVYNQWYYTLYNQARANDVIIGKEQFLFGEGYINAHLGADYLGEDSIKKKVDRLRMIADTLKSKDIDFIMVLAPGKASFYKEYLPIKYTKDADAPTNYLEIRKQLQQSNIHCLDFFEWFSLMKDTSTYPLFPKTGIHWSKYGEVLAADSILKYIGNIRTTEVPCIDTFGFDITSEVRGTDDDIEKGMNVFTHIPDLTMGYFYTQIVPDSNHNYPKVSVIADSYYWGLHNMHLTDKGFNKGDFWYYFNEVYHTDGREMEKIGDIDNILSEIESNKVIILLTTDANLRNFDHGFTDKMYELYYPNSGE